MLPFHDWPSTRMTSEGRKRDDAGSDKHRCHHSFFFVRRVEDHSLRFFFISKREFDKMLGEMSEESETSIVWWM